MADLDSNGILHGLIDSYARDTGQWATFSELARSTGGGGRRADLFVMGLWPSCPRSIVYEIKVDRADFQREIADPSKRAVWEPIASECFFATPPGLVKVDEVPEGWGLVFVSEGDEGRTRLSVRKKASQKKIETWPFDFCQSISRRSADPFPPFPRGVSVELAGGRRVDLPTLRRLVERLHTRPAPREDDRTRREHALKEAARRIRVENIQLGTMKRALESHFRTHIRSYKHLSELLNGSATLPPDPTLAAKLRELAAKLDPETP